MLKILFTLSFIVFFTQNSYSFMTKQNAHQFSFIDVNGQEINLSNYQGNPILIVNTASKCGFTKQYQALQTLYEQYQNQGLKIIAVPSADFGNQEFSSQDKVKEFVDDNFKITFDLTEINKVSGANAHEFYLWANSKAGFLGSPKWNFHKYLIDKNGDFVDWFSSATSPISDKITNKIEQILNDKSQ